MQDAHGDLLLDALSMYRIGSPKLDLLLWTDIITMRKDKLAVILRPNLMIM